MQLRKFTSLVLAAALFAAPAARVSADGGDVAAGVLLGVIGSAVVRDAKKKKRTTTRSTMSSATRQQNREVQTSLNYFGFPAGTPDGVLGRKSRTAVSNYQAFMGYPVTGALTQFERDFLLNSYNRAMAGGAATAQVVSTHPQGTRGLLLNYRNELAGGGTAAGVTTASTSGTPPAAAAPAGTLPTFAVQQQGPSLASHCSKVSLLTSTNGGFTTLASMQDPALALNEQMCLARTYAIATGEDLGAKVAGVSAAQMESQCAAFGPVLKAHVAALSTKPRDEVLRGVSSFVLGSGMSPDQLTTTAKICLSVGYRTDQMDVAIGSGLILVSLGQAVYGALMGHHLSLGFGTATRPDLATQWFDLAVDALNRGAQPAFAPGQPDRPALIQAASYQMNGGAPAAQAGSLPVFAVQD